MDENVIVEDTGTEMSGILLKDHTGTPVEYELPQKLRVDTTDGGTALYVHESLVAEPVETTVALDFSGGDMTVTPEDGKVFSGVNIPVPEGLIPENIAEGVDIAGIIGAFKGGGGDIKVASGSGYKSIADGVSVIEHNLGVVPDIFFYWTEFTSANNRLYCAMGFSKAFQSKLSLLYGYNVMGVGKGTAVKVISTAYNGGIDTFAHGIHVIAAATETTVSVGNSEFKTATSYIPSWIAIGGLT